MSESEILNRKAKRDYHFTDSIEAGIALKGTEVKSLRSGKANLADSFARIEKGEAILYNFHISHYDKGNRENHEEKRARKLLLHKREIIKLSQEMAVAGKSAVPLKGYFKNRRFKILLGIGKGKNVRDKREDIKKREVDRNLRRAVSLRNTKH